ncbi:hypothetical protein Tco_0796673 [Tanacetum coccineum]
MPHQPVRGPPVGLKPKSTFVYRPVSTKKAAKANRNPKVQTTSKATTPTLNSFEALSTLVDEEEGWVEGDQGVEFDKDEVEMPDDEMSRNIASTGG